MPHATEQVNGDTTFHLEPHWHSDPNNLRVICVGAGAAGLLVAYKMKKMFSKYELVVYDKNPSVAGTWYENRYPGCACDVPAHAYTFTFEPNPIWSSFYAYSAEIKQYFEDFADKHSLRPWVRLNTRVLSATWVEEQGLYRVELEGEGQRFSDWRHVLINGTGFLNSWKWPKIPGLHDFEGQLLHDFEGQLLHSANWDPKAEWKDKRVAVIGTGSSAIQMVPQIQTTAKHLVSFMRSMTWISPPLGAAALEQEKRKSVKNASGESVHEADPAAQYFYSEEEKKHFRDDPEYHLAYRRKLESSVNNLFDMFIADSEVSKQAEAQMRTEMERRIGPGHGELKKRLIPSWPPGCRRLTPGDGYLEALVKPNVTTCHEEIDKVVPEGLIDMTGKLHEVDIIACATGFNLAFAPPFEVRGVNGVTMRDEFDPEPQVYLAMTVPKFPNYFVVDGVRGNWAAGTALPSHEVCVEYILKCVAKIQQEGIRALEVKQEPVDQLYEYIEEWHKGSALHYMKTIKEVKWEHYDHRYRKRNMWSYLGNGRVKAEVMRDVDKLAPYMRNPDVPWDID